MSLQGRILIALAALSLIVFIINLVRVRKLHVGYAVVWLLPTLLVIVLVSVPPLLDLVTWAVGATYPASALSLLAFIFIFIILIFISIQVSLLSERVVELAQYLALSQGNDRHAPGADISSDRELALSSGAAVLGEARE